MHGREPLIEKIIYYKKFTTKKKVRNSEVFKTIFFLEKVFNLKYCIHKGEHRNEGILTTIKV